MQKLLKSQIWKLPVQLSSAFAVQTLIYLSIFSITETVNKFLQT